MNSPVRKEHFLLAIFWAVVVPNLWAAQAAPPREPQPEARMTTQPDSVDIEGKGWKLHYGTRFSVTATALHSRRPQLALAGQGRAWFAHWGWLRLIDTQKGKVIGRWHFTDFISALKVQGDSVEVQYELEAPDNRTITRKMVVTPGTTKRIDFVSPNSYMLSRVPVFEVERPGAYSVFGVSPVTDVKSEAFADLLSQTRDMAQRDPLSPFIQTAYGKFLKDAGDPKANSAFEAALAIEATDFTELFALAGYFDHIGERGFGRQAFEKGYKDYIRRGNDPRMFTVLIGRLMFLQNSWNPQNMSEDARREMLERIYRLTPYSEGSELAWSLYADRLRATDPAAAKVWDARADESRREDIIRWPVRRTDWALIFNTGTVVAIVLYMVVLWLRYRPQRKLEAAKPDAGSFTGRALRSFAYWTRSERYRFVLLTVVLWYSFGALTLYLNGAFRLFATPINMWMGSLSTPQGQEYLEKMPDFDARNFLLALSKQQSGDPETAMRIYLGQPQYAQAWNNLGVIYRQRGDETKAKEAFEKALQTDPDLNEAKLNLGLPTSDPWTTAFKTYRPGEPMLAPPNGTQMREAYLGMSERKLLLLASAGPLMKGVGAVTRLPDVISMLSDVNIPVPILLFYPLILGMAIVLVFFVPYREVTEAPPRSLDWIELFTPGTARAWGLVGALALALWGVWLYGAALTLKIHTPFALSYIGTPNISRAYLLPGEYLSALKAEVPHWSLMYVLPVVLLAVNALLVLRGRRRS